MPSLISRDETRHYEPHSPSFGDDADLDDARWRLLRDVRVAGATIRQMSRWCNVPKSTVSYYLSREPLQPIRPGREGYFRRLREAIAADPATASDLLVDLWRRAGGRGKPPALLDRLIHPEQEH